MRETKRIWGKQAAGTDEDYLKYIENGKTKSIKQAVTTQLTDTDSNLTFFFFITWHKQDWENSHFSVYPDNSSSAYTGGIS